MPFAPSSFLLEAFQQRKYLSGTTSLQLPNVGRGLQHQKHCPRGSKPEAGLGTAYIGCEAVPMTHKVLLRRRGRWNHRRCFLECALSPSCLCAAPAPATTPTPVPGSPNSVACVLSHHPDAVVAREVASRGGQNQASSSTNLHKSQETHASL